MLQLVRDFIHDSLYHPTEGYFTRKTASGECISALLGADLWVAAFLTGHQAPLFLLLIWIYPPPKAWHQPVAPPPARLRLACRPPARRVAGAAVVGTLRQPLDFRSFAGQTDYLLAVQVRWRHPALDACGICCSLLGLH